MKDGEGLGHDSADSSELITKEAPQSLDEANAKLFMYESALCIIAMPDMGVYTQELHAVVAKNVASAALDGLYVRRDDTGCIYFSMDML